MFRRRMANAIILFDGKDLSNFDSFLKTKGLNSDPNGEVEKPHREWDVVEIVAQGDHLKHYLNGKLVQAGRF